MKSLDQLKKKVTEIKNTKDTKKDILRNKLPMSFRICIEIASAIIAGLIIGGLLDYTFNTKWIFKLICLVLGCIASFRVLYKMMVENK